MSRFLAICLLALLIGCGGSSIPTPVPTFSASDFTPPAPTATVPIPTQVPPTPTDPPPTQANFPLDLSLSEDGIMLFPTPAIYEGERITIQVTAFVPRIVDQNIVEATVAIDGQQTIKGRLSETNLGNEPTVFFEWVWDTTDQVGSHTMTVLLDEQNLIERGDENPDNNSVTIAFEVLSKDGLSQSEQAAEWITADSAHATLHVISGTAAHRDLEQLKATVDTAARWSSERLNHPLDQPINIYFIDRVIGQGGYANPASGVVVVTYLDRDYSGGSLDSVLRHEIAHIMDFAYAPGRIIFVAEGMAVWTAGGHYRESNIHQLARSLITSNQFISLDTLIDNFYPTQHEIGYLEAASFISWLIDIHGLDKVKLFVAEATDTNVYTLGTSSEAKLINELLKQHFDTTLPQAEADWLVYLDTLPRDGSLVAQYSNQLSTTIRYYNTMRRYQEAYDPSAYYLRAWLPFPAHAAEIRQTADLSRHPQTETNIAIEAMLTAADTAINNEDYQQANGLLSSIDRVLDSGTFLDPFSSNFLSIVRSANEIGYEVHAVEIEGSEAAVFATNAASPAIKQLTYNLTNQTWIRIQ